MAKKTKREKHIHVHDEPVIKPLRRSLSLKDVKIPASLFVVLLVTIVVYLPVFRAGFVWDDSSYVQNNSLIHSMNLEEIFSQYVMGNYHPFTILVLAVEYQLFGLNATGYHVMNLLLHLANVLLVYYSMYLLTKKNNISLISALFFSIHPLLTESVAWVSGIKDLLYSSFYLGSLIFYLKYIIQKQNTFYVAALVLFLFSLLSKATAVTLPLVMLLADYFLGRKWNRKTWIEKAPFFLLAIIFGIVAILAQQSSGAIQEISNYSFLERSVFACYGLITYLWKFLLPVNQSAFYPYPIKSGEALGIVYYIYPLLALGLLALAIHSRRFTRKIVFGIGFFVFTIIPVLQLVPVGEAIMADRYSYIPSIGIFYLAGEGINRMWQSKKKIWAISLMTLLFTFFSVTAFIRNKVWKNGATLWTDVIRKFPETAIGYNNRSGIYLMEKKFDQALADVNKVIQLNPQQAEALNIRGVILSNKKRTAEALNDLNKAIQLRPDYAEALSNRGLIFMERSDYNAALNDFNKAVQLRPGYAEAYYNRGLLFMNEKKYELAERDYDKALQLRPGYTEALINRDIILKNKTSPEKNLEDYNKAIVANPTDPRLYYQRGLLLTSLDMNIKAIFDFNKAIELNPGYAEAYQGRGDVFARQKNTTGAINDFSKAVELDPALSKAYLGRANLFRDENKNDDALRDYNKAIELDTSYAAAYYNRGILLIKEKKFEKVIGDFSKVLELKGDSAMSYYNIGMAELFLNKKEAACYNLKTAAGMGLEAALNSYKQFCK